MNFEHSWGDGFTILNFQNHIYEYLKSCSPILTKDSKEVRIEEPPIPLSIGIDDAMEKEITQACEFHNKRIEQFHVHCLNVGNAPGLNLPHWFVDQASFFIGSSYTVRTWLVLT